MEFSTRQQDHRSAIQVNVTKKIQISWSAKHPNKQFQMCKKNLRKLEELTGTNHQTIDYTIVHDQRNKSSKTSEMQSLKNSPLSWHHDYVYVW